MSLRVAVYDGLCEALTFQAHMRAILRRERSNIDLVGIIEGSKRRAMRDIEEPP